MNECKFDIKNRNALKPVKREALQPFLSPILQLQLKQKNFKGHLGNETSALESDSKPDSVSRDFNEDYLRSLNTRK